MSFTLALTNDKEVLSWGYDGKAGYLGLGDGHLFVSQPTYIPNFVDVMGMATGGKHSVAWTTSGDLYTFGSGRDGIMGLGSEKDKAYIPTHVKLVSQATKQKLVYMVNCNYRNSFAVLGPDSAFLYYGRDRDVISASYYKHVKELRSLVSMRWRSDTSHMLLFDSTGRHLQDDWLVRKMIVEMHQRGVTPAFFLVEIESVMKREQCPELMFEWETRRLTYVSVPKLIDLLVYSSSGLLCTPYTSLRKPEVTLGSCPPAAYQFHDVFLLCYMHYYKISCLDLLRALIDRYNDQPQNDLPSWVPLR